nr:hypothetical protein [Tanacetum cinerariifolium]
MKRKIAELPMLITPIEGETMIMYLSARKKQSTHSCRQRGVIDKYLLITDQPIRKNQSMPENSGRLAKSMIEFGEHDICYRLRTSIRRQVLADFFVEVSAGRNNPTEELAKAPMKVVV